jgi:hypothetical protein
MIVRNVIHIRCDRCGIAWIYPESDIVAFLTEHGWSADDGRHECPMCVRKK